MVIEKVELISKLNEFRENHGRFQTSISIRSIHDKKKIYLQLVLYLFDDNNSIGEIVLFERIFNGFTTAGVNMRTISSLYTDYFSTVNIWEIEKNKEDLDKWIDSKIKSEAL